MRIAVFLLALLPLTAQAGKITATWGPRLGVEFGGAIAPFSARFEVHPTRQNLLMPILTIQVDGLTPNDQSWLITPENSDSYGADWATVTDAFVNTDGRYYLPYLGNLVNPALGGYPWLSTFPNHTPVFTAIDSIELKIDQTFISTNGENLVGRWQWQVAGEGYYVPEPGAWALALCAVLGLWGIRRSAYDFYRPYQARTPNGAEARVRRTMFGVLLATLIALLCPLAAGADTFGEGRAVVLITDGIDYTHEAVSGNYAGGWDFAEQDSDPYADGELNLVGTAQADLICRLAPDVELYVLRVWDDDALGWPPYSGNALTWVHEELGSRGDEVIVVYDGWKPHTSGVQGTYTSSPNPYGWDNKIADILNDGAIVVASSGRDYHQHYTEDRLSWPAIASGVIPVMTFNGDFTQTIGGADYYEQFFFSNRASNGYAAPGHYFNLALVGGGYDYFGLDSIAVAYFAGVLANDNPSSGPYDCNPGGPVARSF